MFDYMKRYALSDETREYLAEWLEWAENGAPNGKRFFNSFGLCANSKFREDIQEELASVFKVYYPFGEEEYENCQSDGTMHLCPKRLAFVRANLPEPTTNPSSEPSS